MKEQTDLYSFERVIYADGSVGLHMRNAFTSLPGVECFLIDILKAVDYNNIMLQGRIAIDKMGTYSSLLEAKQALCSTELILDQHTVHMRLKFENFLLSEQFLEEWNARNKYRNHIE